MAERSEALMRIVVKIVSGIVLGLWKSLVNLVSALNFWITLITGSRNKDLANFCEMWNTQQYVFLRYSTFVTNERPFPFNDLTKNFSKFRK